MMTLQDIIQDMIEATRNYSQAWDQLGPGKDGWLNYGMSEAAHKVTCDLELYLENHEDPLEVARSYEARCLLPYDPCLQDQPFYIEKGMRAVLSAGASMIHQIGPDQVNPRKPR